MCSKLWDGSIGVQKLGDFWRIVDEIGHFLVRENWEVIIDLLAKMCNQRDL